VLLRESWLSLCASAVSPRSGFGIDPVSVALTAFAGRLTLVTVGISLLGPMQVDDGESLEPRDRIALSVLAVRRGHVVAPEQLADALWGEEPPASWRKQVQICVARLRKVLGAHAIETSPRGYRLAVNGDDLDIDRFEQLLERARLLAATAQPERSAATFARALSLWRGRPLSELDDWPPGRIEATRLEEMRRTTEEDWLESRLAAGEQRPVAIEAEAFVAREPLRERRWAILALAQYRCSRQGDALRSLTRARKTLVEQLGVEPGPELSALEAAILRHDPDLAAIPEPTVVSDTCPYKGLAPYDVDDTETFFGRDAEVAACLDRIRVTPLLLVAGPSGCGKSSLVRAGLVPRLRQQGRPAAVFVPGVGAEAAMSEATASTDYGVTLIIDQFEEVFTAGGQPDAARDFCRKVGEYAANVATVVIAMRSDHLGGLGVDHDFSRLAERGLHLVAPLAGDSLRQAIERPAQLAGLRLEHGLVELLLRDCEGEPGALPLLSHALVETWRRRDGPVLTVEGYRATGGIRGAVARSADRLYDSLPSEQRAILRSVLLRLVTPSLEGDPVRCRVPSRSLLGDAERERVVALLVRSRLVTSEQDTFEVAHEALARAWPRLRSWLDDDAAGQRILRHLAAAADGWDSLGRPPSELYRGARLDTALEWRAATRPDLTDLEHEFIEASTEHATSESRQLADRARRDARQNRRLRVLLVAAALFLVASIVVGSLAIRQRQRADDQRQLAHARELAAAATANLSIDPERSMLLALAALDPSRSATGSVLPEATQALHDAVTASRIERHIPDLGGTVDWSGDGTLFVTEGPDSSGIVDIRDTATGKSVRSYRGHSGDISGVAFNDDGTMLATTGIDGTARIWNPATGEQLHELAGAGATGARGPSFSPDGSRFAAAWPDDGGGVVRVLDLKTGRTLREVRSVFGPSATSFDPTGAHLAIASSGEPKAVIVDAESGEEVLIMSGHFSEVEDVAWSPDGNAVATAAADSSTRVFDAKTGNQRFALLGHRSHIRDVDWSPDSTRLVTGSADGTAKVWSLIEGDGRELLSLSALDTRNGIAGVAFSPDGTRVLTGNDGATAAIIWDVGVSGGAEVANLPSVSYFYPAAEFTHDGRQLVATGPSGSIAVWDARTFRQIRTFGSPIEAPPVASAFPSVPVGTLSDITRLAVDPTGRLVAGIREEAAAPTSKEGRVQVWDVDTGRELFTARVGTQALDVAWSPDGQSLAIAGHDAPTGIVTVVDRAGRQINHTEFADTWVGSIRFTPDGRRLVAALEAAGRYEASEGRVVVWDWQTDESGLTIRSETSRAEPSPTGTLVAAGPHSQSKSQRVEVWDWASRSLVTRLSGHTGAVLDLAFNADGSQLATASADGTIRLWDPRTGAQLLRLNVPIALVSSVSFSPDGVRLVTASADGIIRIWTRDIDELAAIAERRLTRSLTNEECQQYLHVPQCP